MWAGRRAPGYCTAWLPILIAVATVFSSSMKATRHKLTVDKIYWLNPDTAVADGDAEISNLKGADGATMPPLRAKFTSVGVNQDGTWLVSHLRSYVYLQP
jgi:hypothetical protein